MDVIASQITRFTIVYSLVYSDADQSKHQSSASLAIVREIHQGPVNSPHKWPVTRKMFPFDDVIMKATPVVYRHLRPQAMLYRANLMKRYQDLFSVSPDYILDIGIYHAIRLVLWMRQLGTRSPMTLAGTASQPVVVCTFLLLGTLTHQEKKTYRQVSNIKTHFSRQ